MALIIPTASSHIQVCTPNTEPSWFATDGSMTLEAMQKLVGGYIEHVQLHPAVQIEGVIYPHLIVNEEGKLRRLPENHTATMLVQVLGLNDIIVGDAILMTDAEFT